MNILELDNIGKSYRQYSSEWHRIGTWIGIPFKPVNEFWVIRDISLSLIRGETVGIVGENGAGKSTLLKAIAGIIKPTNGRITLSGNVSAILELGIGFNQELTGRENVINSAAMMGFDARTIESYMESIESFADIGEYFDKPVRTYSSGMQVRVAFSVATAIRPDILIIDEALSVGDSYFQHKSFDRIRHLRDQGTTILFVSHSAASVKALCTRAILMHKGIIIADGETDTILDRYNALMADKTTNYKITQTENNIGKIVTRSGTGDALIKYSRLIDNKQQSVTALRSGSQATIRIAITTINFIDELTVGILIKDKFGNEVFGTNTAHHTMSKCNIDSNSDLCIDFTFAKLQLGVGTYSVSVALHQSYVHVSGNYDWRDLAIVFDVYRDDKPFSIGVISPPVMITWLADSMIIDPD